MKIRNILMSALLIAAGTLSANAQEEKTETTVFQPHWYVGAQGGAQYTLGELDFTDHISPNVQVQVGYNFNPLLGLRLAVNGWESKHGLRCWFIVDYNEGKAISKEIFSYGWKNKYVAPNLDLTFNLTNLFCGFNPNRPLNVGVFAGIGATIGFDNEAGGVITKLTELKELKNRHSGTNPDVQNENEIRSDQNINHNWDGTLLRAQGQAGLYADYRISDAVSIGLEVNANALSDHYNSKHAPNMDWFYNALVGVKVNLGKTTAKKVTIVEKPEPIIIEKIVEKIVEKPVPVEAAKTIEREPLRVDVFFLICGTQPTATEKLKIQEVVKYLNKYPTATVEVTGYADKGTGKADSNMRLSQKRRDIVVDELLKAGIDSSRIKADAKGDTVQPFDINDLNRVTICIAK